jgi:hypothetical protein
MWPAVGSRSAAIIRNFPSRPPGATELPRRKEHNDMIAIRL